MSTDDFSVANAQTEFEAGDLRKALSKLKPVRYHRRPRIRVVYTLDQPLRQGGMIVEKLYFSGFTIAPRSIRPMRRIARFLRPQVSIWGAGRFTWGIERRRGARRGWRDIT